MRDQGVLSLESVQEFYDIIGQEPRDASMRVTNLFDFCNFSGYNELDHQPVITLVKTSSRTGETQGHAVVLQSYDRDEDCLVLTTIDSASETGQTFIICSIDTENGRKKLMIRDKVDQLCLGSDKCYVLYFN